VDTLNGEKGQASVIVVLALAVGVVALVGLRLAQDRVVHGAHIQRAGEAAVEAAAQSLADAYATRSVSAREVAADPGTVEAARAAASLLAGLNGATGVQDLVVVCANSRMEARLVLEGYTHRAGFTAPECSPP
jgi:hypothetical protein